MDPSIYVSSIAIAFEIIIAISMYIILFVRGNARGSLQEVAPIVTKPFVKKSESKTDVSIKPRHTSWINALSIAILLACTIADELAVILSFRYAIAGQLTFCFWFVATLLSAGGVMIGPSIKHLFAVGLSFASLVVLLLQAVPIPNTERDVAIFTFVGLSVLINHSSLSKMAEPTPEFALFTTEVAITSFVVANVFYSFLGGWHTREVVFTLTKLIYLVSISTLLLPKEGSSRRDAY